MASSRNYRPRPIDVRKVMPVMRDLHLPPVPRPEEIGVEGDDRRGGSAGSYGMSSEDAEEKNFVIAFQAAVQAALAGKSGAGACPLSRAASLARHSSHQPAGSPNLCIISRARPQHTRPQPVSLTLAVPSALSGCRRGEQRHSHPRYRDRQGVQRALQGAQVHAARQLYPQFRYDDGEGCGRGL
jgi:hypothetical protein